MGEDLVGRQVDEVVVTGEQRAAFLGLLRAEPGIGHVLALRRVGVGGTKGQLHEWLDGQDIRDELEDATAAPIRREVIRRAIEGVEEPVFGRVGKDEDGVVGSKTVYSDRLLELAWRGYTPEGRAATINRRVEVGGLDGRPIEIQQGVALADVVAVLQAAGVDLTAGDRAGDARPALPPAREVLAEPE